MPDYSFNRIIDIFSSFSFTFKRYESPELVFMSYTKLVLLPLLYFFSEGKLLAIKHWTHTTYRFESSLIKWGHWYEHLVKSYKDSAFTWRHPLREEACPRAFSNTNNCIYLLYIRFLLLCFRVIDPKKQEVNYQSGLSNIRSVSGIYTLFSSHWDLSFCIASFDHLSESADVWKVVLGHTIRLEWWITIIVKSR